MSDNERVIHLADVKQDNRLITPVDMFREAIRDIEDGRETDKAVAILLNTKCKDCDEDHAYEWDILLSNLNRHDLIALLEIIKAYMLANYY